MFGDVVPSICGVVSLVTPCPFELSDAGSSVITGAVGAVIEVSVAWRSILIVAMLPTVPEASVASMPIVLMPVVTNPVVLT